MQVIVHSPVTELGHGGVWVSAPTQQSSCHTAFGCRANRNPDLAGPYNLSVPYCFFQPFVELSQTLENLENSDVQSRVEAKNCVSPQFELKQPDCSIAPDGVVPGENRPILCGLFGDNG
jgi:hypothetical protein